MIQNLYLLTLWGTKWEHEASYLFFRNIKIKHLCCHCCLSHLPHHPMLASASCFMLQPRARAFPGRGGTTGLFSQVDCNCVGQGRLSFLEANPDYLFLRVTQTSSCGRVINADVGVTTWSETEWSVSTGHSVARKVAITRTLKSWPGHCRLPAKPNGQ